MTTEICPDCKGVIYPFERDNKTSCLCVPADYEQCAECGFDHGYDPAEANHAHNLIAWDAAEKFPQDQMTEIERK